jgi:uncharacterized protein
MAYGLYDTTIPNLQAGLTSLAHILRKGEEFANQRGIDVTQLLNARLCDDMLPLTFQVHICTDFSAKVLHRTQNAPETGWEPNMVTMKDLMDRIAKAQAILSTADVAIIESRQDKRMRMDHGPGLQQDLPVKAYLDSFIMPNFYFHLTTTYAILRSLGVPLGKADYLAPYITRNK